MPTIVEVHGEQRGAFEVKFSDSRTQRGDLVCVSVVACCNDGCVGQSDLKCDLPRVVCGLWPVASTLLSVARQIWLAAQTSRVTYKVGTPK